MLGEERNCCCMAGCRGVLVGSLRVVVDARIRFWALGPAHSGFTTGCLLPVSGFEWVVISPCLDVEAAFRISSETVFPARIGLRIEWLLPRVPAGWSFPIAQPFAATHSSGALRLLCSYFDA